MGSRRYEPIHRTASPHPRRPGSVADFVAGPQRYQGLLEAAPLVHNADERIDVRDLGFATSFFVDIARDILG